MVTFTWKRPHWIKLKFPKTDYKLNLAAFWDKAASALDEAFPLNPLHAAAASCKLHVFHSLTSLIKVISCHSHTVVKDQHNFLTNIRVSTTTKYE